MNVGRMCREDDAAIVSALTASGVETWGDLPLGAVVATCTLVDVVPIIDPDDCIEALPEPIPARGRQQLWEWNEPRAEVA